MKTQMNPRVFWGASIIVALMLSSTLIAPGASDQIFSAAQSWAIDTFGWLYVASVAAFVVVVLVLGFGPAGRLRLGPDDSTELAPLAARLARAEGLEGHARAAERRLPRRPA